MVSGRMKRINRISQIFAQLLHRIPGVNKGTKSAATFSFALQTKTRIVLFDKSQGLYSKKKGNIFLSFHNGQSTNSKSISFNVRQFVSRNLCLVLHPVSRQIVINIFRPSVYLGWSFSVRP